MISWRSVVAVLIVDDRPNARRYHRLWLQAQAKWSDGAFIECATFQQAVDAARDNAVEFVILDLNLDANNRGVATLEKFLLESGVPARKVFVVTADSDNVELVAKCLALGVADVSNSGQAPWGTPPQIFNDAQLAELQRQISASIGAEITKKIETEFVRLQEEQARRDKLKQAEGIMTALRVVAGVLATALGGWLMSFAPAAVKALLVSVLAGGKSQ